MLQAEIVWFGFVGCFFSCHIELNEMTNDA